MDAVPPRMFATTLQLKSVNTSNHHLNGDAMMNLLLSLSGTQSISFEHSFSGNDLSVGGERANSYALELRLLSSANLHEAFVKHCRAGLQLACPELHFEPIVTFAAESASDERHFVHAWQIRLAPVVLKPRKTVHTNETSHAGTVELPYPTAILGGGVNLDLLGAEPDLTR